MSLTVTDSEFSNFDPKDLFTIWKSGSLIENFEDILDDDEDENESPSDPVKKEDKPKAPKELMPIVVPALLKTTNTDPALKKGSLLGMLKKEKNNRDIAASSSISSDPSRFRGVYRQPLLKGQQQQPVAPTPTAVSTTNVSTAGAFAGASGIVYGSTSVTSAVPAAPVAATTTAAAPSSPTAKSQNAPQVARIVKNPFSLAEQVKVSKAKVKNGKKNLAFVVSSSVW